MRSASRSRSIPSPPLALAVLLGVTLLACGDDQRDQASAPPTPTVTTTAEPQPAEPAGWSAAELALMQSLSVSALPPPPPSPSNRVADDPRAAELGWRLFFDPTLSGDGEVACATCHVPGLRFTDGRALSRGMGDVPRNAPTLVGAAHSPWQYWDGRRDSLWAQALVPFEAALEMGTTRLAVVRRALADETRARLHAVVFGGLPTWLSDPTLPDSAGPFGTPAQREAWKALPLATREAIDRSYADLGKAIEAYERLLRPGPTAFDTYVEALTRGEAAAGTEAMSPLAERGLRLFLDVGRTQCLQCHNGPQLTNHSFHRVATSRSMTGIPELGRFVGIQALLLDPFNCLGPYSDADPSNCTDLRFLNRREIGEWSGAFKTPTLRGLAQTSPYMHDGRFANLSEVLEHYRKPPPKSEMPHELNGLDLESDDLDALAAFLGTLSAPPSTEPQWLTPPEPPPTP